MDEHNMITGCDLCPVNVFSLLDAYTALLIGFQRLKEHVRTIMFYNTRDIVLQYSYVLCEDLKVILHFEEDDSSLNGMQELMTQIKLWFHLLLVYDCVKIGNKINHTIRHTIPGNPGHVQATSASNSVYDFANKVPDEIEHMVRNSKRTPKVKNLDDVAGLKEVKSILRTALVLPQIHPQLFTGDRRPWSRVLLYGPPGTGKTYLAHAVAAEVNAEFYCISSADLLSRWYGESEKMIKFLFEYIQKRKSLKVLFIDEIDSLCRKRTSGDEDLIRRIKTELLIGLENIESDSVPVKTFFICATNCPWEIDSAFIRRFQKRVYIALPDSSARESIMKKHCDGITVCLTPSEWTILVKQTEGYSGSDLETLTRDALFQPIREMDNCTHWMSSDTGHMLPCTPGTHGAVECRLQDLSKDQVKVRDIEFKDFCSALINTKKTVTEEDIKKYNSFTEMFGQTG